MLPDKVVLLLGNHDIQYIVPNRICSGHRPEIGFDLKEIFEQNKDLFKMAHQEIIDGKKWLWTHGGVSIGWYRQASAFLVKPENAKLHEINAKFAAGEVDEMINHLWNLNADVLYQVDAESGGWCRWAGPLWLRTRIMKEFTLPGYNQVVGHTHKKQFTTIETKEGDTIYYIDCLEETKQGFEIN